MPLCEYGCGNIAKHYFKNVKKWCCSKSHNQCKVIKSKQKATMIKKYGVEYTFQSPKLFKKFQQTMIDRYGVAVPLKSTIIIDKQKQTMMDRYGVENAGHSEEISNKRKETCKRKYGTEYVIQTSSVREKIKKTFKKKYGTENITESDYFKKKSKETCKKKYGDSKRNTRNKDNIKKQRLTIIKTLEDRLENGHQLTPNFNPDACNLIDDYGKTHGYNFIHAMNGGEHHIKELGYWVDGYDAEKNTVIEIDESHHFDTDGNLTEKDVRRQNEIVDFLGCEFIRLKI